MGGSLRALYIFIEDGGRLEEIAVKAVLRILSDDYVHKPRDDEVQLREGEFREMYLVPRLDGKGFQSHWNAKAGRLKLKYAEFLTNLTEKACPGISKEDDSSTCTLGRIKLKVDDCQYGSRLDLPRVYVYGFPREFRRLIKDRRINRIQPFENVKYEIDVTEAGKTTKFCLTLHEGGPNYSRGKTCYRKGTVMKLEVTQNGKWASMRGEVNPPKHIPTEQEYLWVMKRKPMPLSGA